MSSFILSYLFIVILLKTNPKLNIFFSFLIYLSEKTRLIFFSKTFHNEKVNKQEEFKMEDENLVTITNNENPPINLEITAYRNEVNIELVESVESVLAAHNVCEDAHNNRFSDLEDRVNIKMQANSAEIKTELDAKADIEATNALLTNKLDKSDTTVTKLGNSFNGANQLLQIDSSGKLPALNGSLLTELPARKQSIKQHNGGRRSKYEHCRNKNRNRHLSKWNFMV